MWYIYSKTCISKLYFAICHNLLLLVMKLLLSPSYWTPLCIFKYISCSKGLMESIPSAQSYSQQRNPETGTMLTWVWPHTTLQTLSSFHVRSVGCFYGRLTKFILWCALHQHLLKTLLQEKLFFKLCLFYSKLTYWY